MQQSVQSWGWISPKGKLYPDTFENKTDAVDYYATVCCYEGELIRVLIYPATNKGSK